MHHDHFGQGQDGHMILLSYKMLFLLILCLNFNIIFATSEESLESRINSLPEKQKQQLIEKIQRRILDEVNSKKAPNQEHVEVSDKDLDAHAEFVKSILEEESNNLRRNKEVHEETKKEEVNKKESEPYTDLTRSENISKDTRKFNPLMVRNVRKKRERYNEKETIIPVAVLTDEEAKKYLSENANETTTVKLLHQDVDSAVELTTDVTENKDDDPKIETTAVEELTETTTFLLDPKSNDPEPTTEKVFNVPETTSYDNVSDLITANVVNDEVTEGLANTETDEFSKLETITSVFEDVSSYPETTTEVVTKTTTKLQEEANDYATPTSVLKEARIATSVNNENVLQVTEENTPGFQRIFTYKNISNRTADDKSVVESKVTVINDSKTKYFGPINLKKAATRTVQFDENGSPEAKTYSVFEVDPDNPPFVTKKDQHRIGREGDRETTQEPNQEQPFIVPVYNYAVKNAYFNPYNRFAPNPDDEIENGNLSDDVLKYENDERRIFGRKIVKKNFQRPIVLKRKYRKIVQSKNATQFRNKEAWIVDYYYGKHRKNNDKNTIDVNINDDSGKKSVKIVFGTDTGPNKVNTSDNYETQSQETSFEDLEEIFSREKPGNQKKVADTDDDSGALSIEVSESPFKNMKQELLSNRRNVSRLLNHLSSKRNQVSNRSHLNRLIEDLGLDYDYVNGYTEKSKRRGCGGPNKKECCDEASDELRPECQQNVQGLQNGGVYAANSYLLTQKNFKKVDFIIPTYFNIFNKTKPQPGYEDPYSPEVIKYDKQPGKPKNLLLRTEILHEEVDRYVETLKELVGNSSNALKQYNWLETTVDIEAALQKLIDLCNTEEKEEKIHQYDEEILKYARYLFKKANKQLKKNVKPKANLYDESKHVALIDLVDLTRSQLSKNKNRRNFDRDSKAVAEINSILHELFLNDVETKVKKSQIDEDTKSEKKDFKKFLLHLQNSLSDFHNAIKHIASVTKYKDQHWFDNISQLYLSKPVKKQYLTVLLHIFTTRFLELIEKSAADGLDNNYEKYVRSHKTDASRTKQEISFVLEILDEISCIE